jgi:hypothetical protein
VRVRVRVRANCCRSTAVADHSCRLSESPPCSCNTRSHPACTPPPQNAAMGDAAAGPAVDDPTCTPVNVAAMCTRQGELGFRDDQARKNRCSQGCAWHQAEQALESVPHLLHGRLISIMQSIMLCMMPRMMNTSTDSPDWTARCCHDFFSSILQWSRVSLLSQHALTSTQWEQANPNPNPNSCSPA